MPNSLELAELIKTRLIGVRPDDQDLVLDDADWQLIATSLNRIEVLERDNAKIPELQRFKWNDVELERQIKRTELLEDAIRRALESLCGDYPSMAADLRAVLAAAIEREDPRGWDD